MDQQEIEKLEDELYRITDEFRSSLDKNNTHTIYHDNTKIILYDIEADKIEEYIYEILQFVNNIEPSSIKEEFIHDESNIIDLSNLFITRRIELPKTTFPLRVDFSNTTFSREVDFNYSIFNQEACFKNVVFTKFTNFNNIVFKARATFTSASFAGIVNFGDITCETWIFADNVIFKNTAIFSNAIFENRVNFEKAIFMNRAHFDNTIFKGWADFNHATFENWADFDNTKFRRESSFSSIKFKNITIFQKCIFNNAPLFHESTFHQDTSFENTQFLRCETEDDYRAYRTLKQHMNNVHAKLEENMFFALEQRTRRNLDAQDMRKNWFSVILSYKYDNITGYGQDLLKPVLWLVCTWYAFAGVFSFSGMVGVSDKLKGTWFESIFPGFGYSTQNIFNPLSAVNFLNIDRAFYPYNPVIAFLGWLEAILSIAFITLWLLAVRRRFQKGE